MDSRAYPSIPQALWTYHQELPAKNPSHPLLEAIKTQGEEQTWKGINSLFDITCRNTRLDPDRLLRQLGFDDRNFDPNYLPAILGIMRNINMLNKIGFTNIHPLPPKRSRREADLTAEYAGVKLAVEVFRSSETAYRYPSHSDPNHNLERYIADRYTKKRSQLDATIKAHQCSGALLAVVMDSSPAKQLTAGNEWTVTAKETFDLMGNPANTHLLIFTGLSDPSTGKDEFVVYPPLAG
jgi:hypothetical protein